MKNVPRQDRNGTRTSEELRRRYKLNDIDLTKDEVEIIKTLIVVDEALSTTSTNSVQNKVVTQALNSKVNKETGKGLSTNDFTDTYKSNLESAATNNHTHSNKAILDKVTQTLLDNSHAHTNKAILDNLTQAVINNSHTHSNKTVLDKITQTNLDNWNRASTKATYNLASYKVSGLTILRSSCIKKDDRVVINFTGTISMAANTTTTLFTLPEAIRPTAIKDFVAFGQTNNNDGYIGYGQISTEGSLQVRFNTAISSYIRFSLVYDLD